mmetsp:Transcript_19084/g.44899  ORF Transcript_19084/g.44899 Transcript_19084/m.44899 type:complete len:220 (-) Transcript_19084:132-791(-)
MATTRMLQSKHATDQKKSTTPVGRERSSRGRRLNLLALMGFISACHFPHISSFTACLTASIESVPLLLFAASLFALRIPSSTASAMACLISQTSGIGLAAIPGMTLPFGSTKWPPFRTVWNLGDRLLPFAVPLGFATTHPDPWVPCNAAASVNSSTFSVVRASLRGAACRMAKVPCAPAPPATPQTSRCARLSWSTPGSRSSDTVSDEACRSPQESSRP